MDLYKTVTVFSTLFSIALVVAGMIALDSATARATRSAGEVNLPIAILGVVAIVLGAATYAFAARFRAEGMGNPKDADDER
jgi:predicted membrane channel-forming protein YqfA (hemolysin III family)